ncbi:putative basic proline-rich protein-like [Iris pallida]|uniref:Basic proline-rich protein-like n=1 Tax=Iris pallida TaxID=29817 RepID=A0AAX6GGW6_IRIPA|nr:putative basic proline-rich protein-like [Iris pallida]
MRIRSTTRVGVNAAAWEPLASVRQIQRVLGRPDLLVSYAALALDLTTMARATRYSPPRTVGAARGEPSPVPHPHDHPTMNPYAAYLHRQIPSSSRRDAPCRFLFASRETRPDPRAFTIRPRRPLRRTHREQPRGEADPSRCFLWRPQRMTARRWPRDLAHFLLLHALLAPP